MPIEEREAHEIKGRYRKVQFSFRLPGSGEEFYSESFSKQIAGRFRELSRIIDPNYYKVKELPSRAFNFEVHGDVKARIFKAGHFFDVEFLLDLKQGKQSGGEPEAN